jgi:hypothetical protein
MHLNISINKGIFTNKEGTETPFYKEAIIQFGKLPEVMDVLKKPCTIKVLPVPGAGIEPA